MSLPPQPERSFQQQVYDAARLLGWKSYHTQVSRASAAGFPDLVLVRRPRVVAAELKRDGYDATADQRDWLDEFAASGVETYVWHPSDWPEIERVLAR
jgi:ribosomal protein L37E